MIPSSVRAVLILLPLLSACEIHTYREAPRRPPPRPAHPAATAATTKPQSAPREPSPAAMPPLRPAPTPSPRPLPLSAPSEDVTPKVEGKTIFGGGEKAAFRGLAYVIPKNTKTMPDLSALVPFGRLYASEFNIASQDFSGGFPGALLQDEWFAIRYDGRFNVPKAGEITMRLVSDDGAILYVDGVKAIDNDGVHTAKTITAKAHLTAGMHRLRLDYFQAEKGKVALQLFLVEGGKETPLVGAE